MSLQKQASPQKENKMGVMPVKRLIISMSLPMMASMLVQALYNIVDSIFVSQINEQALTAVTLAFPIQTLMVAVGSGTGVGINALLSKSLGEKKIDRSDAAANTGLLLIFFSYLVFLLIGIFGMELFFNTQTSDPQIVEYGISYLRIICCLSRFRSAPAVGERGVQLLHQNKHLFHDRYPLSFSFPSLSPGTTVS